MNLDEGTRAGISSNPYLEWCRFAQASAARFAAATAISSDFIRRSSCDRLDSIAAEIELAKRRSARFFGFVDDNIFLSKQRIKHITKTMLERELGVVWGGFFRVDRIDEDNVNEIAASGCAFGLCGIESGDDGQLDRMGKGCTADEARRGIELSTGAGISLNLSILIGFPGETRESIDNTIAFLNGVSNDHRGLAVLAGVSVFSASEHGGRQPGVPAGVQPEWAWREMAA